MTRWLRAALALLVINSAYLYSFESPTIFYVANLLLHLGLGALVLVGLVVFLRSSLRQMPWISRIAIVLMIAGGLLGGALIITGATRPYQWLLWTHIITIAAGFVLFVVASLIAGQSRALLATALAVAVLLPLGVRTWYRYYPNLSWEIRNPVVVPARMEEEGPGPDSPFFPSSANTDVNRTIPSAFFMKPESCANEGCHPDIYKQWSSSAHRFSSFNNQWYRKSIEYMQEVVGTKPSKWCAGCHDHAVFFNGMMDQPIKDQLHKPEAHAGLTCTSCHSIVSVGSTMGNGHFVIEYPPLHDLATSENRLIKGVHDFVVKLDPGPHRRTFIKPFFREQTPDYCSSCHKVHLDIPVNNYRWVRGFNDYDAWQNSGISGHSARSFYYPKQSKKCADCHMPLVPSKDAGNIDGFVHSHRFPAANTALPFVNNDQEQLETVINFLKNDQVGVDIFAISEATEPADDLARQRVASAEEPQISSTFAEGDQMGFAVGVGAGYTEATKILAPVNRVNPAVRAGDTVRVDVVVRTKNVGHFFPGGTVDGFDVWVELQAVDEGGKTIFWSGYVPQDESGRKGPVEPSAHFYRSFMLDANGNHINKRNAWMARSVLYVRLIPPGAADTVHYRLKIPKEASGTITLKAKVNYRKFAWWNTQWAYAGVRDPNQVAASIAPGYDDGKWVFTGDLSAVSGKLKDIPDLPIVVMAESTAQLKVVPAGSDLSQQKAVLDPNDLIRWNDYGIGLLLQGDLKAAEEIFRRVVEINPKYVDGYVNIGRVRVQEGRTEEAQQVLLEALKLDPELAKTHFFLGVTYKTQGNYEEALEHLRKAESKYPQDRVVLNQIGRILFLERQFNEAVEVLNRVLLVDPEDLQAHYNLMLSYRGLGNKAMAEHEQKLYMRFKADESSQAITGPHRLAHPENNNERQAIHEHPSIAMEKVPGVSRQYTKAGVKGPIAAVTR
ncbi:MAG: tetratricopeptide repeat protein [Acidobacteria bacterium]|nr:MAG: tetratricopeptide repeat protein [Acidobacteriota bacterium]